MGRGKKRVAGGAFVPDNAPDIEVGQSGRPAGSGIGPAREAQKMGTAAARSAAVARRAALEAGVPFDDQTVEESERERTEHYFKCNSLQANWKAQVPCLLSRYYERLPANLDRIKRKADVEKADMQAEIEGPWIHHACNLRDPSSEITRDSFSRQPDGMVMYYGKEYVFELTLPVWKCCCCSQSFSPHPIDFGCFPSTPVTAHVWYDIRLLQQYMDEGPREGLSITGRGRRFHL